MVGRSWGRVLLRNSALTAFVITPIMLLVFWIVGMIAGEGDGSGILDLSVLFPWLALLLVIGAVLFTFGVEIADRLGVALSRTTAIPFAPLVLVPWLITPARALLQHPPLIVGALVGLAVFIRVASLPTPAAEA
jgi:hypothetical protein